MNGKLQREVLKGVSRSFYLSLRLLPAPMRSAASLAYLLARSSDTLADASDAPLDLRLDALTQFRRAIVEQSGSPRWPIAVLNGVADFRERRLLESADDILSQLKFLPEGEVHLVREVLETIVSGQLFDLQYFTNASSRNPVALENDIALEDYTWRVAGCVGAFWTKLGFLTLGDRFSNNDQSRLIEKGISYGKGLQLVNILRDLPADIAVGRCYLPISDPHDRVALLACHSGWLDRAKSWIAEGEDYAKSLKIRRLRTATVLPARIALPTLEAMQGVSWDRLQERIKVPRSTVYRALIRALF
ncbi:MAG: squalene/phytoene synthase family protein [Akkermansiaceae bacterium]|nr:squalene/phytoene synthase family protein [Akkermansiaceae bacterium]